MLYGRSDAERVIRGLLVAGAEGRSGALAVIAGAGEGKSALLAQTAIWVRTGESFSAAPGSESAPVRAVRWRVLRVTGVQSGGEIAFSGLRRLLEPVREHISVLPAPQRTALSSALSSDPADPPERFLVGLAVLSLLAEAAVRGPVLCSVDDAQWVDRPSVDALLFAARRLGSDGVVMLFAGRPEFEAPGVPVLTLPPLDADAARALLAARNPDLALEIRERVIAESAGNPLALLELPGMNTESPPVGPMALSERLQSGFGGQIARLPESTRFALVVAAAEHGGDLGVILGTLRELGSGANALAAAEGTGMLAVTARSVRFRHPLIRAAAYRSATAAERVTVHGALAVALAAEPERAVWHRAAAATGPDETVAAALEVTAESARGRTGHGAAATAWERAARLTPDPAQRTRRLVHAVENAADAGQFTRACLLARQARESTRSPAHRARLAGVLAHIEFEHGSPVIAHRLLHAGATEAAAMDPALAAAMLFDAGRMAWFLGDLDAFRDSRTVLAGLAPSPDRDRFLRYYDGILALYGADLAAGIRLIRGNAAAPQDVRHHSPQVRFVLATQTLIVGDLDTTREILADLAEGCRVRGLLGWLALAELWQGTVEFMLGHFREAELLTTEGRRIAQHIGQPVRIVHADSNLALLAAVRGMAVDGPAGAARGAAGGEFSPFHRAHVDWARALADMGAGHYARALDRMEALGAIPTARHAQWLPVLADRVEAAVRLDQRERAVQPLAELRLWAEALETPWAEALLLRATALLDDDPAAFARALESHAAQCRPFDRARTGLLYGEWLRRERRTTEARAELQDALRTFERLGADPWTTRTRNELRAAGVGTLPAPQPDPTAQLTPQELQVARLAAAGATNREIAALLYVSPKTVGHHLSRSFRKLGVAGRKDLARLELH
ncbi:LuxR C-terminal-related transcriptional regulator [Nocardia sp. NPDC057668]|uniref:LuxR C-terminal-related transcriptional regulator n=1 Tax=Nocardia sp. NPDC057668 TaxID=3346202 RepID=UPI00366F3049